MPERDAARIAELKRTKRRNALHAYVSGIRLEPRPHQRMILDEVAAERLAGHHRNLIVAATGTGKTLVSAFDYQQLVKEHGPLTLLFVAHRQEILKQSLVAYQLVMQDGGFGELLVGGHAPDKGQHVFASIQSLHSKRLSDVDPHAYDVVVVDEFHHAEASTYTALLNHLQPRYLVGLTATPERSDGIDVLHWFDGRIASELRLWDALEQRLLSPFQYFGIADTVDFASVKFTRNTYHRQALNDVITGDHFRATRVIDSTFKYVENPHEMKAIGFCVSIDHAELMADAFNAAGLPAVAVSSRSGADARHGAKQRLASGEVVCLFVVDIFNEGVDIPSVDTVLFLRPTESGTVFLQQLGRGLRLSDDKECLTVLDFVGNAHKRYRYDIKYRALLGGTRRAIADAVERGFPRLPPGCEIHLEKRAQDYVLANIKSSLNSGVRGLADELREAAEIHGAAMSLKEFLTATRLTLQDVYANSNRSWSDLRRRAGLDWPEPAEGEAHWLKGTARALHIDDLERLSRWEDVLTQPEPPHGLDRERGADRELMMLLSVLRYDFIDLNDTDDFFQALWQHQAVRRELLELMDVQRDRLRHTTRFLAVQELVDVPLRVHATYSRDEVMMALGVFKGDTLYQPREGVVWVPERNVDVFFVTLQKSEDEYSPQTLYRDYPISERLFHWESQHTTTADSKTGARYINHKSRGSEVLLFVREQKKVNGMTQPYLFLGACDYVRHESERPMQMTWALREPMPGAFFQRAKIAAG